MLAVDGPGIPLNLLTEAANISEYRLALQTIDGISVATRPLHPRIRPDMLVADKGYDAQWLRNALSKRHIRSYIPRRRRRGKTEEPHYNSTVQHLCATRWIVERTNAWLKTTGESRFAGIAMQTPTRHLLNLPVFLSVYGGFRDEF